VGHVKEENYRNHPHTEDNLRRKRREERKKQDLAFSAFSFTLIIFMCHE
jgi:hypothetical protein